MSETHKTGQWLEAIDQFCVFRYDKVNNCSMIMLYEM